MKEEKKLLKYFIEWLSNKEDVFYAFDNTDSAIEEFLESTNRTNTEKP